MFDDEEEQSYSKKQDEIQKTFEKPSYTSKMAMVILSIPPTQFLSIFQMLSDLQSKVFSGNDAQFSPVQKTNTRTKAQAEIEDKQPQNGTKKGAPTNPWTQPKEEQYKVEKDVLAGLKEEKKKYGGKKIEGVEIQQLLQSLAPEYKEMHKQSVSWIFGFVN